MELEDFLSAETTISLTGKTFFPDYSIFYFQSIFYSFINELCIKKTENSSLTKI